MSKLTLLLSSLALILLFSMPVFSDETTVNSETPESTENNENSGDESSSNENTSEESLTGCEVIVDLDKRTMEMPCVLVNGEKYQVKMSTQRGNSMNWKVVFLALEDDSVILDETDESTENSSNDDANSNEEEDSSNDSSETPGESEETESEEDDSNENEEEDENTETECVPASANANNCKDKEK